MVVFRKIIGFVLTVFVLISSLFPVGEHPKQNNMPELKTGEYTRYVDPFIGTGGIPWVCAMLSPCATTPFGCVRLGADTCFPGNTYLFTCGTSGYYYPHENLLGFSHTRLSGTGATDMGHFRVTPAVGDTSPADRLSVPLKFSHNAETASPGYYAVYLPEISCLAEMTATVNVGVHRYSFETAEDAHLFIDATSFLGDGRASDGEIEYDAEKNEIRGAGTVYTSFTGRYSGLRAYFVAVPDREIQSYSTWDGDGSVENRARAYGDDCGINLGFGNLQGENVTLKIGISFVSEENAAENLAAQARSLDFDAVRVEADKMWNDSLSDIKITSDDSEILTVFYTALYHSMIMPTDFTDENGEYLGFNNTVGTADGFTYRTDMSLWDTYRTLNPLLTLIEPEIQLDCVKSLLKMADEGGCLPRWPSGGGYTGSMFGSPADMMIAESYLKGITDFDAEKALEYMKKVSDASLSDSNRGRGRTGEDEYNALGYCPADKTDISVSRTLEYAWADASIAKLAQALGDEDSAAYYLAKSKNYKNLFDPVTKYFRARNSDGSWVKNFSTKITSFIDDALPVKYAEGYSEGSAGQWRWSVPHDTQGLIELFGGNEYFVAELEEFMGDTARSRAALNPGAGYWQGNEHDIHAAYLFVDAGRADLTQKWVRRILTERHCADVNGLDGNDDGGTLSAWYVFSSMGFYPIAGTDEYRIGSPNVNSAEIALGGGKILKVRAENQSAENIYVQSVTFNGQPLESGVFRHEMIADGGEFVFIMGPSPARTFG